MKPFCDTSFTSIRLPFNAVLQLKLSRVHPLQFYNSSFQAMKLGSEWWTYLKTGTIGLSRRIEVFFEISKISIIGISVNSVFQHMQHSVCNTCKWQSWENYSGTLCDEYLLKERRRWRVVCKIQQCNPSWVWDVITKLKRSDMKVTFYSVKITSVSWQGLFFRFLHLNLWYPIHTWFTQPT